MSYNIEIAGTKAKVLEKLKAALGKNPCHIAYEEEIRQANGASAIKSIENLNDTAAIRVKLSGSAYNDTNSFTAEVQPIYGFVG